MSDPEFAAISAQIAHLEQLLRDLDDQQLATLRRLLARFQPD